MVAFLVSCYLLDYRAASETSVMVLVLLTWLQPAVHLPRRLFIHAEDLFNIHQYNSFNALVNYNSECGLLSYGYLNS